MLATSITSTTPVTSDAKQTLLTLQTISQGLSALHLYCPQYNGILASTAVEHSNTSCFIQAFLRDQESKHNSTSTMDRKGDYYAKMVAMPA